jgi:hypothetical protein
MKRWVKLFQQHKFDCPSSPEGWRLALITEKRLDVYKETPTGNELCWTVELKAEEVLSPKNFVPVSSRWVGTPVMPLYDAQGLERAVIIGLTDKEYLLVSDPSLNLGLKNPSEPHLYDGTRRKEFTPNVPTDDLDRGVCWSMLVEDLDTGRDEYALKALGGCRGAFVLCVHQIK